MKRRRSVPASGRLSGSVRKRTEAYEIRGQKRGTYILVYFKAPGKDVAHIERDCNLSERILRTLILRADHMTEEQMRSADARKELEIEAKLRAERPAAVAPAPVAATAEVVEEADA